MHYLSRSALCAGIAGIFILAGTSPAFAAETAASEIVIIPEGDTVTEDLYAVGSRVLVEGTIEGDLIAFAAEEVIISGRVMGNVQAVAPTVTIDGEVSGSVRFTANRLTISGSIGGDLVGASVRAELSPESTIDGDVVVWAFRLVAAGTIETDLEGTQRTLELAGSVGGDVDVSVNQLTVTGPLEVAGDLGYRSPSEAEGIDQARVEGVVAHKTPLPPNIRVRALGWLARFLVVLGLTCAALLVAWGWPGRTESAGERARRNPWRALGRGALVILSPFIVAGIAALIAGLVPASASLPLLAVFVPLILALAGLVLVLSLVAGVPAILALGRALPGERGLYGSVVAGSIVVGILWMIPYVGWLVPLLVLPIGMGSWMLSFQGREDTADDPSNSLTTDPPSGSGTTVKDPAT
jgi:cytoskeletal protein CcmA (bactofilin family)